MKTTARIAVFLSLTAAGCGRGENAPRPRIERRAADSTRLGDLQSGIFSLFEDVDRLAPQLRRAADAVVKIERQDGVVGSGVFVSGVGLGADSAPLLLTNEHVLGEESCARQGCVVRLHMSHERNPSKDPLSGWFTLRPFAHSASLDAAAYTVFEDRSAARTYRHPHSLSVDDPGSVGPDDSSRATIASPAGAEANRVYLIGFPLGYLKKSLPGNRISETPPFLNTEILSLPGTSGGPIVDPSGLFLGLHHRGTQNVEYLRNQSYFGVSLSTSRSAVRQLLYSADRQASLAGFSQTDPDPLDSASWTRLAAALAAQAVGGLPPFDPSAVGPAATRAETFWRHCSVTTPATCSAAASLVSCRTPGATHPLSTPAQTRGRDPERLPLRFCPTGTEAQVWSERFQAFAAQLDTESGLYWSVQKVLELLPPETEQAEINKQASTLFADWYQSAGKQRRVGDAVRALDMTGSPELSGQDTSNWFKDLRALENYYFQYQNLLRGVYLLARSERWEPPLASRSLRTTRDDPRATLSDHLLADFLDWRLEASINGEESLSPYALP